MTTLTPDRIVECARQWKDVPFKHQGRTAKGIDCAGLIILVAREIGVVAPEFDENNYPRTSPHSGAFRKYFDEHLIWKRNNKPSIGDVVIMKEPAFPCHCGIVGERYGELTLIHAYARRKKVVEELLVHYLDRMVGVYEWPI